MPTSFSDWVESKKQRSGKRQVGYNGGPLGSISEREQEGLQADIESLLSNDDSIHSRPVSLSRSLVRKPPTVSDARLLRLESEVIRLADQVGDLSRTMQELIVYIRVLAAGPPPATKPELAG